MHQNKGKTIRQCLSYRLDYGKNPDKTQEGQLISAYACDPETADAEFALSKREYFQLTGRRQDSDVIAYQVRQSFRPGEITPEEANRIGYEFAERFLKGNHAFIVCTHTDKQHIHNHIYWNSTSLDCTRKFRNFWGSTMAVRKLSDLICVQHRLSVIENPKPHGISYNRWQGDIKKLSNRDRLCLDMDAALANNPAVVYPHSFRHRFAKSFLERCNDIAFLADLMGHESIETTRIYLRKTSTEQRAIVDEVIDW